MNFCVYNCWVFLIWSAFIIFLKEILNRVVPNSNRYIFVFQYYFIFCISHFIKMIFFVTEGYDWSNMSLTSSGVTLWKWNCTDGISIWQGTQLCVLVWTRETTPLSGILTFSLFQSDSSTHHCSIEMNRCLLKTVCLFSYWICVSYCVACVIIITCCKSNWSAVGWKYAIRILTTLLLLLDDRLWLGWCVKRKFIWRN